MHVAAGSRRARTFVAFDAALSANLCSALCFCSAFACPVVSVARKAIWVRGGSLPPVDSYITPRIVSSRSPS